MNFSELKSFMLYLVILLSVYLIKNLIDILLNIRGDGATKKDIVKKVFKEAWILFMYNVIILIISIIPEILDIDKEVYKVIKKYISYSYVGQFAFWLIIPTFMNFISNRPIYIKFIELIQSFKLLQQSTNQNKDTNKGE